MKWFCWKLLINIWMIMIIIALMMMRMIMINKSGVRLRF